MPFFVKTDGTPDSKTRLQVRATLAFILTIGATAGFFMGLIPVDSFMPLVIMAVSRYFSSATPPSQKPPPTE